MLRFRLFYSDCMVVLKQVVYEDYCSSSSQVQLGLIITWGNSLVVSPPNEVAGSIPEFFTCVVLLCSP